MHSARNRRFKLTFSNSLAITKTKQKTMENKNLKRITKITYPGFALLALACFALSPTLRAVSPAPDGGYPNNNTAEGTDALFNLTTGSDNTATVIERSIATQPAANNTATGDLALFSNNSRQQQHGQRLSALYSNTTGDYNTASGSQALGNNTTGSDNTANGYQALFSNTTGYYNTANGYHALYNNTSGYYNTANGYQALYNNNGQNNTALGYFALGNNITGSSNIALGYQAGSKSHHRQQQY